MRETVMECPKCHRKPRVINSRFEDGKRWRRHRCEHCGERFSTYEITADEYERLQSTKVNVSAIRSAIEALRVVEKAVS
jgi:transcriptional regulator NrdR family protein